MSETYQEARENVVRMAQHYIDYCASYGTECSFYEYCEPDIPMTPETKELIANIEKYEKLDKHYFIHDFGDGWRASVRVDIVTAAEAQKARKNSAGFAGYDWLIKNILSGKMKGMKIRD